MRGGLDIKGKPGTWCRVAEPAASHTNSKSSLGITLSLVQHSSLSICGHEDKHTTSVTLTLLNTCNGLIVAMSISGIGGHAPLARSKISEAWH